MDIIRLSQILYFKLPINNQDFFYNMEENYHFRNLLLNKNYI